MHHHLIINVIIAVQLTFLEQALENRFMFMFDLKSMTSVSIECQVNPSEDPDKVATANIFPDAELELDDKGFKGTATIDHFSKQIRKQKILDATRGVMLKNRRGDKTWVNLNKQVATVGKVSYVDKNPILGAIEVCIQDDDIEGLIDIVAPVTVDGEEVKI